MTITKEHLFSWWVDRILTPELLGPDRSFVVQVYGTPGITSAAPAAPHGPGYFVIYPSTGSAISWPPPEALDDAGLDRFAHPLQPVTGG